MHARKKFSFFLFINYREASLIKITFVKADANDLKEFMLQ